MAAKTVNGTFSKERETKGTFVYAEDGEDTTHAVGKLYVKKPAAEALGNPEKIKVVISAV